MDGTDSSASLVLAFDRDWTVDVNKHPQYEAVPLEWVRYWAHNEEHDVWAIGNQDLVEEADIPGIEEIIRCRDGDISALGTQDENGYYDWWPEREERLYILAELFPEADHYIVVDDIDLSHVDGWDHYKAWEFIPAVENGSVPLETPEKKSKSTMTDDEIDVEEKEYKYDASDESEEEIKAQLEEWREEYPSAEVVDDGGVKITNDEDTIAEAQRRGEFSNPDEHEEEDSDN